MKRRNFISQTAQVSTSFLLLSTFLSSCKTKNLIHDLNHTTGPYTFKEIRGGVGFFEEKGGTIGWSINKYGVSVIDTQFPDQAKNLLAELDKYNPDGKIDLLINTHHHGDHTSGNIVFKDRIGQHVAHENAIQNYKRVVTSQNTQDKALFPTISFSNKVDFKLGSESIRLYYFGPGHTDGDAIIHYENANVAHLGDLIFNRRFPYIDKSSGANIVSWINVLDKVEKQFDKNTIFIFGHKGEGYEVTGTIEDVKAFQNYLVKLLEFGKSALASGKTIEEIKTTTTFIPGAEEWKGDGIGRSLDALYLELTSGN